jgi:hypothetical protein
MLWILGPKGRSCINLRLPPGSKMAEQGRLTHKQYEKFLYFCTGTKSMAATQKIHIYQALFETSAQNTVIYSSDQFCRKTLQKVCRFAEIVINEHRDQRGKSI